MEKAIVTFENPDAKTEIRLEMMFDKENNNLDYDVKFSNNVSMKENMDLAAFLANMFLNSLQAEDTEIDETDKPYVN